MSVNITRVFVGGAPFFLFSHEAYIDAFSSLYSKQNNAAAKNVRHNISHTVHQMFSLIIHNNKQKIIMIHFIHSNYSTTKKKKLALIQVCINTYKHENAW